MYIDESKERFDLSDHNMVIAYFNAKCDKSISFRKVKRESVFLKTDEDSLKIFADTVEEKMDLEINYIEQFDEVLFEEAETHLKRKYKQRTSSKDINVVEQPWVTEEIRKEIKKRKKINRKHRNTEEGEEKL